ncbi:response regulator transcription factor [Streptomyces spectabilis]|uniref:DNA-binding response OmpR family regulator n=1 Tax=Streptomyces spectabilis TaxID=68270 RepID=A0A5P2XC78_STRST|nr:response regulator transcription factor [Streptomyces spectabilis]MBB5103586.1 DNA-binding response OmpR family regulator [Streptomyces spectabilis]MCI3904168.1 response regulator transcription factor [Streptomyces spectabilis]QEV61294.1 DNA-binding response regulator [Streptomyces spectabilis]
MCAFVLVAEDDEKQADLIRRYLEREGHTVGVAHDGRTALERVRLHDPDLLILDVMMPEIDGLGVTRVLRSDPAPGAPGTGRGTGTLPILMLTARSTEDDLLLGLDLGADDYLTKPYSPRELMARVRTLLRRASGAAHRPPPEGDAQVLRAGGLVVDALRHEVTVDGQRVECTPGEFELLAAMAAEPERVFTRPQLLDRIHGSSGYISVRTVDVHVLNLRKKIEENPRTPQRLVTVFGVGYKLVAYQGPGAAPSALPAARRRGPAAGETAGRRGA